jgi:hypothetical protein
MSASQYHQHTLIDMVERSPWFMSALSAVQTLQLESWCIGAGAVRTLVWDQLHGYSNTSALTDVDVVYFDANDLTPAAEQILQRQLLELCPDVPWEVTNQAAVHLWFADVLGYPVQPLLSLEQAIASWPEFATAVGVTLNEKSQLEVIAPYGMDDLFAMIVRRNPARVSEKTYRQRIEQKQYAQRWPKVKVLDC